MKKTKGILAALLSAVMAAALVSGSAMAAEAQNTTGTNPESVVGIEDETARLRRINPHIDDEQWEIIERLDNPEENGLVMVDETQRLEDGQLIIDSYYTDAIDLLAYGKKTYYATSRILSDGTTDGELILKLYMFADFEFDSEINYVGLVSGSAWGSYIKYVDTEFPNIINPKESKIDNTGVDDSKYGINNCTLFYTVTAVLEHHIVTYYSVYITVDSRGVQVSESLQDQKP